MSIKKWGWTIPVLLDESGVIIAGHGRVMAAKKLKLDTIPCMTAKGWSEENRRAYVIADNKLAEDAGWDQDILKSELTDLQALSYDLAPIGFSADALVPILGADAPPPIRPDGIEDAPPSAYKEQYGVIVMCASEAEQKATYDELVAAGKKVKVVVT